jgi:hypothetical protein
MKVVACRIGQGTPAESGYSLLLIGKAVRAELAEKCRFYLPKVKQRSLSKDPLL